MIVFVCVFCMNALKHASGRGWFGLTVRAGCGLRRGCEECGAPCVKRGRWGGGRDRGSEAASLCDARRPQRQVQGGAPSRAETDGGLV